MSLRINRVPPTRGVSWVRTSLALFLRHPFGFSLLFLLFLVMAMILMILPLVGALLLLALMPLLTLGYAAAARAAASGQPVNAGALFEPFLGGADAARRRTLVQLCLLYAALTALSMLLAQAIDGGAFERLQVLMAAARSEDNQRQIDALLADRSLAQGMFVRLTLLGLLAVPFWHAPMLVWWHGQGLAQSLFSSALALWRNKGAFTAYLLTWLALSALLGVVGSVLVATLGSRNLAGIVLPPAALLLSVAFYVSLYPMFADSFTSGAASP
jgi:hypothetical protein